MKIFNNFTLSKIINLTILCYLGYELIASVLTPYISLFEMYFGSSNHISSELDTVTFQITQLHTQIMTSIFLLSVVLCLKRSLSLISLSLIVLLSFQFNSYMLIDNYIHPILFKTGLYDFLLRPGQTEINPQYSRILLFLLVYLNLLFLILIKSFRSIDRAFVFIILSASLIILTIFHMAIPMGILKYTKNQRFAEFSNTVNSSSVEYLCSTFDCVTANEEFKVFYVSNNFPNLNIEINTKLQFIAQNKTNFISGSMGDFIGTKYVFFACKKIDSQTKCIINNNPMKLYGVISKLWFSFLTSIAHCFWFFGGLFLLFLHKTKRIRKIT